jgi:hypothetical protein
MGNIKVTNQTYGKPLIILSEMCFGYYEGMKLPFFALYENNQIIYRKETKNDKMEYFEVLLNEDEKNEFLKSLPFDKMYNLTEKAIDASGGWTDQPMSILELNIDGFIKIIVDGENEKYIPKDYLLIYKTLINYGNKKSHKWYPESICIIFNDAYSDEKSIEWPIEFPKINLNEKRDDRNNLPLIMKNIYLKEFFEFYINLPRYPNIKFENNLYSIHYNMEYPNIKYDESIGWEEDDI